MEHTKLLATEWGILQLTADDQALTGVRWTQHPYESMPNELLFRAAEQLKEYFTGERERFDLPFRAQGTVFQKQVWQTIAAIPYGQTRTYRDIAVQMGRTAATARAVGAAAGKNPLWIIIPCHRVIGADGTLTGYAGGVERKAKLLGLEQKYKGKLHKK